MARRFTCKSAGVKTCDFAVESELKGELVEIVQAHVKEKHGKDISKDEILEASETLKHKEAEETYSGGVGP